MVTSSFYSNITATVPIEDMGLTQEKVHIYKENPASTKTFLERYPNVRPNVPETLHCNDLLTLKCMVRLLFPKRCGITLSFKLKRT